MPSLGDGLIIANTDSAGQELMKLRLNTRDFTAFPIVNLSAIDFVKRNDFKEVRTEKRMRLGPKRKWESINIYNRIGGNLG